MNLPFQRVSAADVLHPVSQAHADLREVESESRRSHMKHQLEKQKAANARACQVADMRLHQAEVHLANCQAELRVYAETSLKSRIVEEHRQRCRQNASVRRKSGMRQKSLGLTAR